MRAVNKYATRTALTEWAGQGYVDRPDAVSLDPRLESFGANTRLAIDVTRFGSALTTFYAYATKTVQDADTGRDVNVGAVVYADTTVGNNKLSFWSGSVWTVDAGLAVDTAMRAAFAAFAAAAVIVDGVPIPGPPGSNAWGDITSKPTNLTGYGVSLPSEPFTPTGGTATTMQKALDPSFGEKLNVLNYRLVSDTGIAAAINRAIIEAASGGGATVVIPNIPGLTYTLESEVTLKSNVLVAGAGKPRLNFAPGMSAFVSEGFRDFTTTGLAGGIENFGVEDIYLYGGWTPATAAALTTSEYALAYYGRKARLKGLTIERARGNGLWTEYADQAHGTSPWDSRIQDITLITIAEVGWYNNADDLQFFGINVRDASRAVDGGFDGVRLVGGCRGAALNVWSSGSISNLPRYALHFDGGGGSELVGANIEGGRLATIRIGTERVKFFGRAHSGAGPCCLLLAGNKNTVDLTTYQGSRSSTIAPMAMEAATLSPINNRVALSISGYNAPVDLTNSDGGNDISIVGEHLVASNFIGGHASDMVTVRTTGAGSQFRSKDTAVASRCSGDNPWHSCNPDKWSDKGQRFCRWPRCSTSVLTISWGRKDSGEFIHYRCIACLPSHGWKVRRADDGRSDLLGGWRHSSLQKCILRLGGDKISMSDAVKFLWKL